jgi:hypothetical protein
MFAIWMFAVGTMCVAQVKHAPTLQSCSADINLWSAQISGFPRGNLDQIRAGTKSLSLKEIDGRTRALIDCSRAYPVFLTGEHGVSAAVALVDLYGTETGIRYMDFLARHEMMAKFYEEDQAGQR